MLISILPSLVVACYLFLPEFKELSESVPLLKPTATPLIRYTDKNGRVSFVSSLEFVPEEYRDQVEVNPDLPRVNRGEFPPVATPTPTPIPRRRGGDSVMRDRREAERRGQGRLSDDTFSERGTKPSDLLPSGVLELLSKKLE